jgi:predicted Zn finger-like uncharacterized protein
MSSPEIMEIRGMKQFRLVGLDPEKIEDYSSLICPTYNRLKRIWRPSITKTWSRIWREGSSTIHVAMFTLGYQYQTNIVMTIECSEELRLVESDRACILTVEVFNSRAILYSQEKKIIETLEQVFSDIQFERFPVMAFTCPRCSAMYASTAIKVREGDEVRCPNCAKWVHYPDVEPIQLPRVDMIEFLPEVRTHGPRHWAFKVFVCPHCGARYSFESLKQDSEGNLICPTCDKTTALYSK